MEIIKPDVQIITEPDNLKRIEIAGRTCYKSESAITEESADKFFCNLIHRGHTSVLEHSNVIIKPCSAECDTVLSYLIASVGFDGNDIPLYIRSTRDNVFSANIRAWRTFISKALEIVHKDMNLGVGVCLYYMFGESDYFEDLLREMRAISDLPIVSFDKNSGSEIQGKVNGELYRLEFLDEHPDPIHNIITTRFVCSRAMSHELVRHRLMGISQESQRYVKYGELTVIEPYWFSNIEHEKYEVARTIFMKSNLEAEHNYSAYIDNGFPPQAARGSLTNDAKTEVVLTGTIPAWERFISLRDSSAAHPDIQILARMFRERVNALPELQKWGL